MEENKELRVVVRGILKEFLKENNLYKEEVMSEETFEEERMSHTDAVSKVKARENFVGSHTFGEDLGGLGGVYVVFSYDRDHPLYIYKDGKWYHNTDDKLNDDGSVNIWSKKHLADLKPGKTLGKPKHWMKKTVNDFMKGKDIDLTHTELKPGEK